VRWLAYGQPDAPFHSGADRDAHVSSKLNSNVHAHSGADRHGHASSKLNSNVHAHSGADRHADAVLQQPADADSPGSTDILSGTEPLGVSELACCRPDSSPDPRTTDKDADRVPERGAVSSAAVIS
jgi:hypothetical protein